MKGLIIKWRNTTCKVGIPDCGVGLMVNITRFDGAFWCVGGVKLPEEIHMTWNGGKLEVGDEIEIEFAEFDQAGPPVVEESHQSILEKASVMVDDNGDVWKRKLDTYYRLKKILEDENLIE